MPRVCRREIENACVHVTQVEVDERVDERTGRGLDRAACMHPNASAERKRLDKRAVIRHLVRLLGNTTLIHCGES